MKDKTTPTFLLNNKNICGIIQRELMELNMYLSQPVGQIDPRVAIAYVGEIHKFVQMLPEITPHGGALEPAKRN